MKAIFVAHEVTATSRATVIEMDTLLMGVLAVAPDTIPAELGGISTADSVLTGAGWNQRHSRAVAFKVHELPFSEETQRLLDAAAAIAKTNDAQVLPEHVLMALLTESFLAESSSIAIALVKAGVSVEALSTALSRRAQTETRQGPSRAVLAPRRNQR